MRISGADNNNVNFQHKILIDIGASNPKGTLKIKAITDAGREIFHENTPNLFLNNTVKGFEGIKDFKNKVYDVVRRTYNKVLALEKDGKINLTPIDKLLSGVAVLVPGTTIALNLFTHKIAFMPNLKDKKGESLEEIVFDDYKEALTDTNNPYGPVEINEKLFNFVVTKDLGGAGVALAKLMAQKEMLKEGDYVMGIMTGGGFGSVDIKVKQDNLVEFETSESSSYVAGNYGIYEQFDKIISQILQSGSPEEAMSALEKLKANSYRDLRHSTQILGKLGRQGVNVKSHIETFCREIGRPDLTPLLQAVGDARIVEKNRMCVSETDTELVEKIRSMKDDFIEIPSTSEGKVAFELNEAKFGKEKLRWGRRASISAYADAISLITINKVNDCLNKVVLLGPFAHGVNEYVKEHSEDFKGAKDLPELIRNKILKKIDEKHIDLPSTRRLMQENCYNLEIICNDELNFPDNTAAADLFLNPRMKFVENRGSWFSIPMSELKNKI